VASTLLASAALLACMGDEPASEQRKGSAESAANKDPWGAAEGSGSGGSAKKPAPSISPMGMLGGLGMLSKIGDSLKEPGPFEAPRTSPGYDAAKPHWLVLTMSGAIVERSSISFTGASGTPLRDVQERLATVAADPKVPGVLLRFADLQLSFPDAIELRDSMKALRAAGKRLLCHTHGTGNVEYLVMSACEQIGLAPLGQIAITGPAAMPVHLRPLLTRFGVVADFLHVGAYKGAAEPFTRDAPSPESTEVLGQILDRYYQTMVEQIAAGRGLPAEQVKTLIDEGVHTPVQAVAAKLVDRVAGFEEFRDAEVQAPWAVAKLDQGSQDAADDPAMAMTALMQFLGAEPAQRPTEPHVALVYALGNIVDGSGEGLLGARQEIAAGTMVAALRVLAADDSVKAVVLRIDSGGGSAQASELIWKEVTALREKKPVIVSMSDMAASGGYYIACNATKIYAEPNTLTGSIGVVGGRLAVGNALAQQGVRSYPVGRGKRATMMASLGAWSAEERQVVQRLMDDVYTTFVGRVAAGRKKPLDEVKAIAQGRVWTGAKAKELGLVDELGGLEAAYAEAAKLGGVALTVEPEIYPPAPTLRDFAVSFGQTSTGWLGDAGVAAAITALDPRVAAIAAELLGQLATFRQSTIQTVAWLPQVR
jgi:protease IV